MAVDRRLTRRQPRVALGQQTIFDATGEAEPPAGNPWRLSEAHRQAGRQGIAQAREILTRAEMRRGS